MLPDKLDEDLLKLAGCCQEDAKRMLFLFSQGCVVLTVSFAFKLATTQSCDQISTIQKEV